MTDRPLVSIDKIETGVGLVAGKASPDIRDSLEESALTQSRLAAEVEALQQGNKDRRKNRKMRAMYARKVYWYLCGYSAGSLVITLLSGWRLWGFGLPDLVLTTIVGSTAVAAIGLVGFVVSGLFKNSN